MLLTLALLGLGGAVYYLDQVRKTEDEKIKIFLKEVENRSTKSNIKPLDLAAYQEALKIAQNAPSSGFFAAAQPGEPGEVAKAAEQ